MQSMMDDVFQLKLLECSSRAKRHNNSFSSLPIWQAEMQQHGTSFCLIFFLDIIMSRFVECNLESSIMKTKWTYHFEAQSLKFHRIEISSCFYFENYKGGLLLMVIYMITNYLSLNIHGFQVV